MGWQLNMRTGEWVETDGNGKVIALKHIDDVESYIKQEAAKVSRRTLRDMVDTIRPGRMQCEK